MSESKPPEWAMNASRKILEIADEAINQILPSEEDVKVFASEKGIRINAQRIYIEFQKGKLKALGGAVHE